MITEQQARELIGQDLTTETGEKIGRIGQIFLDDETGRPEWVTVHTGLFGTSESFVPLADANIGDSGLAVPYEKSRIKDAPNIDVDAGHLSREEEAQLYEYYGLSYTGADTTSGFESGQTGQSDASFGTGTSDSTFAQSSGFAGQSDLSNEAGLSSQSGQTDSSWGQSSGTAGIGSDLTSGDSTTGDSTTGYDTSGPTTDNAMTRSEEQLNVGTEQVETGRARLRKYIVTENVTTTVPVSREEVRVEREPITDANMGSAMSGPDLSEEEHEVVLHAERPVVDKNVTPVERVRLETDTTTDQETVSESVRKEQIEMSDDSSNRNS